MEEAFSELVGIAEQAQSAAAEARRAGAPAISQLNPTAAYVTGGVPSSNPSSGSYFPQNNNASMHTGDIYNASVATSANFGGNYESRQIDASGYDRRQNPAATHSGRGYKNTSGSKSSKSVGQQYHSNSLQSNSSSQNNRGTYGYPTGGRGSGSQYRPNR